MPTEPHAAAGVRLDRWLWVARVYRSRTLAADACVGGKVEVNGQSAKPHKIVRVGDRLDVTMSRGKRVLRLIATAERRGPATSARLLYEDLTPPPPPRQTDVERPRGSGRPTKRERRELDRLRYR